MALPKIKTPTHELIVPSSGLPMTYRPFLVKEQKILLMALESNEQTEMMRAIKQIIVNCVIGEIDVDSLPMFDLEYIFLQLRARSVGETVDLKLSHFGGKNSDGEECAGFHQYEIDLTAIEVYREEGHDPKILLDEESGIGVVLKYPTLHMAEDINEAAEKSQIEVLTDMVVTCIDVIFDKEDVYPAVESSHDELTAFLNDLSQDQFAKITDFFSTMPKLKKDIEWKCTLCGKDETTELEGMANFFG